jgi:ATP-dependent 26S proteasome regulatory subunit
VLATNMKSALDTAFMRRLRFYVRFAFPAERERRTIWRRVFPSLTPLAALDYERLGQFVLTGASIRSIAMNAAFLAAQANGQVTMALLLDAVRSELRKLDQRVNESHFREASLTGACLLDGVRR